ncbi:MAG: 2-oxoglutarate dehydrogenase complex dihydrolipoyllysine-residue succinyltransferase [Gammaproteobacteria bacterium]|nr:2-oxoglutarate dehydrogenase complex dihydrolipoyllysine-residue succinyltransferase [Gammaproteobacteria bacterium]
MIIEVKVPALAESIADATVVTWLKRVGDFVGREEHLTDLETDKVTLEVTATEAGVLKEIKQANGKTVHSNEVLAVIDTDAKGVAAAPVAKPPAAVPAQTKIGPAARKIAQEKNVDIDKIDAGARGGRVTKEDVLKAAAAPSAPVQQEFTPAPGVRSEERVPMTRLRARIAERLKQAQNTAAMLTTFNEVNMQPVMGLRDKYKERFQKEFGVKLGFMSFFTKACIEALRKFPVVNASVDGSDIVYHGYFDVGIAVGTERGLVVPVIHDADRYTFAQLETKVVEFGQKARDGKLSLEELTGGTFTITNGGVFGSLLSTPILNPPQSAILGMHKIQDRPVVENGQIVARPMMYIALSYDHRIIDGQEAVQFLVAVKDALEDPARMLLQI